MMSLRAVVRSAPRTLPRLSSPAIRHSLTRPSPSLVKSAWVPLRSAQFASAFSTTLLRRAPPSEVDEELSVKLESELQFEKEVNDNSIPASVKDFLENSPFVLKDTPGMEDVYLTRKFGNETITVSFSINDIASYEPDQFEEDSALTDVDEELDTPEGRELAEAQADEAGLDDGDEGMTAVPCRLNIIVEKEGKGALNIEAVAQDGQIIVENFYYFKDPKHAHGKSAEVAHAVQDVYPGPPFGTLDEDLQILLERYLEERGISKALAIFAPAYMDLKEQREYDAWLQNVKNFVDA